MWITSGHCYTPAHRAGRLVPVPERDTGGRHHRHRPHRNPGAQEGPPAHDDDALRMSLTTGHDRTPVRRGVRRLPLLLLLVPLVAGLFARARRVPRAWRRPERRAEPEEGPRGQDQEAAGARRPDPVGAGRSPQGHRQHRHRAPWHHRRSGGHASQDRDPPRPHRRRPGEVPGARSRPSRTSTPTSSGSRARRMPSASSCVTARSSSPSASARPTRRSRPRSSSRSSRARRSPTCSRR